MMVDENEWRMINNLFAANMVLFVENKPELQRVNAVIKSFTMNSSEES